MAKNEPVAETTLKPVDSTELAASEASAVQAPPAEVPMIGVQCDHSGFAPGLGVMLVKGHSPYTLEQAALLVNAGLGKVSKAELQRLKSHNLITDPKE